MERVTRTAAELGDIACAILRGASVPAADAEQTADVLLDAERSGVESHGLMRLASYVDRLAGGLMEPHPELQLSVQGAVGQIDGGNGLGPVAACRAADLAAELAQSYGVGVVAVRRSNHFGTAAYYSRRIADHGCIGFAASMAGPTVAPAGGMELLLGTNPFSIAFPAQSLTFCADMATSAAAKGKIRIYEQQGMPIPQGWALDSSGRDTTDPKAALQGILLPMAGHKGYALAMAVDMLCGLLSGAALSGESASVFQTDRPANTGHFMAAVHIGHFLPQEEFSQRAQDWFDKLRSSKKRPGVTRIWIPGEPEAERRAQSEQTVDILPETWRMLEEYRRKYGNQ